MLTELLSLSPRWLLLLGSWCFKELRDLQSWWPFKLQICPQPDGADEMPEGWPHRNSHRLRQRLVGTTNTCHMVYVESQSTLLICRLMHRVYGTGFLKEFTPWSVYVTWEGFLFHCWRHNVFLQWWFRKSFCLKLSEARFKDTIELVEYGIYTKNKKETLEHSPCNLYSRYMDWNVTTVIRHGLYMWNTYRRNMLGIWAFIKRYVLLRPKTVRSYVICLLSSHYILTQEYWFFA